jgi:hypothetical protein
MKLLKTHLQRANNAVSKRNARKIFQGDDEMNGRTFVVGDTHGFGFDMRKIKKAWSEQKSLTKDDVLIQLGDAGFIWYPIGTNPDQEYWCNWLATRNYTLLVVLGNHENMDEIEGLPECEMFGGRVQYYESVGRFGTGRIYFAKRGEIYEINGKKFWSFGGALSTDKDYRTPGISWWEGELPTLQEFEHGMKSLDKVEWEVDYVISHTFPVTIIGDIIHRTPYTEGKFTCPVAEYFFEIYNRLQFKEWHGGHLHEDIRLDFTDTNDGIFHCHYTKPPYELT